MPRARPSVGAAFDALPIGAIVVDRDLRITGWNGAAEELSGWRSDAALGRHISIVTDPSMVAEQQTAFDWARSSMRTVEYETVRRRSDGEPTTVDVSVTPILEGDEVAGFVALVRQRAARADAVSPANDHVVAELRARNGELARAVARAESELEELRQVNLRLRRFAHAVSHDLAQPLAALGGHLELLDDLELEPRARELVARATRSHATVHEAVAAVLRHATAEQASLRRTRLADLVDSVVDAISPTIRAADATIEADPAGTVDVEADAFARALQNLVVNSCRYRHRERPLRIEIRHETVGDVDLVRVVDNGTGFAAGEHQRVFAHGARGTAAAEGSGTGAGLSIVRSIIEDLGGRVWAEDSPGGGATIAIALPRTSRPAR